MQEPKQPIPAFSLPALRKQRVSSDAPFYISLIFLSAIYVLFIVSMLVADAAYMVRSGESHGLSDEWVAEHPTLAIFLNNPIGQALADQDIQYSVKLTMVSCSVTALLSLWVAIPISYLMSRHQFFGKNFLDALLDIPIVLPPLVIGISLLILFQFTPAWLRESIVYQIPAVVIAQFAVACAFAVRTMRATFDQIDTRREEVALTLGCSRYQAFTRVVLPEAKRGILTALTIAWARSLGEFGPLLVFAGATRGKTEVLSTTVFLELSIGNLEAAVAVSLIMVAAAIAVLLITRVWGSRNIGI